MAGMRQQSRRIIYIGRTVTVKHCHGGYRLPDGLPEFATVKIVAQDIGYFDVEFEGKRFSIAMACVNHPLETSGHGCQITGRMENTARNEKILKNPNKNDVF